MTFLPSSFQHSWNLPFSIIVADPKGCNSMQHGVIYDSKKKRKHFLIFKDSVYIVFRENRPNFYQLQTLQYFEISQSLICKFYGKFLTFLHSWWKFHDRILVYSRSSRKKNTHQVDESNVCLQMCVGEVWNWFFMNGHELNFDFERVLNSVKSRWAAFINSYLLVVEFANATSKIIEVLFKTT